MPTLSGHGPLECHASGRPHDSQTHANQNCCPWTNEKRIYSNNSKPTQRGHHKQDIKTSKIEASAITQSTRSPQAAAAESTDYLLEV